MPLLAYLNAHNLQFHVSSEGAVQVFIRPGDPHYRGLWDIDDYLVSSVVSGPSVWMVRKYA